MHRGVVCKGETGVGGGSVRDNCDVRYPAACKAGQPRASPREEGFPGFALYRSNLLLGGFYGDRPHQNYRKKLDGGVSYDAV